MIVMLIAGGVVEELVSVIICVVFVIGCRGRIDLVLEVLGDQSDVNDGRRQADDLNTGERERARFEEGNVAECLAGDWSILVIELLILS